MRMQGRAGARMLGETFARASVSCDNRGSSGLSSGILVILRLRIHQMNVRVMIAYKDFMRATGIRVLPSELARTSAPPPIDTTVAQALSDCCCLWAIGWSLSRAHRQISVMLTNYFVLRVTPGNLLALLPAFDGATAIRSGPLIGVSKVLGQYIVPAVASFRLLSEAAQGPVSVTTCGADCAFHVSVTGHLTNVETSVGACAANCQGSLNLNSKGITVIAPNAFTTLPKVTRICFDFNLLTSIKICTFTGTNLAAVTHISFAANAISDIEAGAINGLLMLEKINFKFAATRLRTSRRVPLRTRQN